MATTVMHRVLGEQFFDKNCHELAQTLLGKLLVRQLQDGTILKGRIVETEAYAGETDKASHTCNGQTARNAAMFEKAGTVYVYFIYGMYHNLNFSSKEPGAGVLIRALEPMEGLETMRSLRKRGFLLKPKDLCSGPGKLSQAFNIITSDFNMHDLTTGNRLWLEDPGSSTEFITVACSRVGIESYGFESVQKPWRYYIYGCIHVSKRNRAAESTLTFEEQPDVSNSMPKRRRNSATSEPSVIRRKSRIQN